MSIQRPDFNSLKNIISKDMNFKLICSKKFNANKYVYDYSLKYQMQDFDGKTLRLFKSNEMPFLPILMKVEKPNLEVLNFIHNFAVSNNIQYQISSMELTFDFFTKNKEAVDAMYSMLVQHVYLKWAGKSFETDYETTTYIGNPRQTRAKAVRIYIKEHEYRKDKARLELILKRRVLKRNNIESIRDLKEDAYYQIINKYLEFKELRLDIYEKKYLRKLRKHDKTLTDDQLQDILHTELYAVKEMRKQKGIVEAFRHIQKQVSGEYECIKGYDFQDVFFNRIINKNFC